MALRGNPEDHLLGPEYTAVRLGGSWTSASLLCFVASLTSRYWMRWIHFEEGWQRPFATVAAMLALSLFGLATGWLAVRAEGSGLARLAMVVNGLALALAALAALAIYIILPKA